MFVLSEWLMLNNSAVNWLIWSFNLQSLCSALISNAPSFKALANAGWLLDAFCAVNSFFISQFVCCHLFQKPWMIWGPVAAVAVTAVTAAVLLRTWGQFSLNALPHWNTCPRIISVLLVGGLLLNTVWFEMLCLKWQQYYQRMSFGGKCMLLVGGLVMSALFTYLLICFFFNECMQVHGRIGLVYQQDKQSTQYVWLNCLMGVLLW